MQDVPNLLSNRNRGSRSMDGTAAFFISRFFVSAGFFVSFMVVGDVWAEGSLAIWWQFLFACM